jgi:hypothetical protein
MDLSRGYCQSTRYACGGLRYRDATGVEPPRLDQAPRRSSCSRGRASVRLVGLAVDSGRDRPDVRRRDLCRARREMVARAAVADLDISTDALARVTVT